MPVVIRMEFCISTHALTWSATSCRSRSISRFQISTHALTWSATWLQHLLQNAPRISTHALTWSATNSWHNLFMIRKFQLTHSRGVRPGNDGKSVNRFHFNSRTHVECDFAQGSLRTNTNISTHALTWSATEATKALEGGSKFQLTHSRGVRLGNANDAAAVLDFNSRTHVECDTMWIPQQEFLL